MSARVVMYSTAVCPYCQRAEALLKARGVTDIEKVRVDREPARRDEMVARTGRRTVPQVFIGDGVRIGKDCMFSDQVGVRTGDMHSIVDAQTGARQNPARSIVIESRVWLCRGATVLKGCTIGADTVVGGRDGDRPAHEERRGRVRGALHEGERDRPQFVVPCR